jgi:hypothetical protein
MVMTPSLPLSDGRLVVRARVALERFSRRHSERVDVTEHPVDREFDRDLRFQPLGAPQVEGTRTPLSAGSLARSERYKEKWPLTPFFTRVFQPLRCATW